MKYTTILPAFLFLAGSALLPISSYAGHCHGDQDATTEVSEDSGVESPDVTTDGSDENTSMSDGTTLDDSAS